MNQLKAYLKLMRPHHYLKNFLIFLPLLFSGNFLCGDLALKTISAFISFSFLASMIYIFNDIQDRQKDSLHPIKKNRPIAAGIVSVKEGYVLIILLVILAIMFNCLSDNNIFSWIILIIYAIMQIGYSLEFKNVPLLDIFILVAGFLLRVLYGASIIHIEVSNWLYLTVISMAFYLGLGKRRNEMSKQDPKTDTRKVLQYYTKDFLDKNMYMCLALTIVFYSLWCVDPINVARYSGMNFLLLTVPIVMIICMKYSLDIESNSFGDPVDVVFGDKILFVLILLYGLILFSLLYLYPIFLH